MYCVKCGVKLQDGVKECPLCHTPVLYDEQSVKDFYCTYSEKYPKATQHEKYLKLSFITTILIGAALACLVACLTIKGKIGWSAYAILGIGLFYIIFVLPFWFKEYKAMLFIPIDYVSVCLFLLFVCLYNHGHWFLSFAFPITMIIAVLTIGGIALYKYTKGGRIMITGCLLIAIGLSFMLVELFQHITFHTPMFIWSLYCVCVFVLAGLFLLISSLIPSLKSYLERKFFI